MQYYNDEASGLALGAFLFFVSFTFCAIGQTRPRFPQRYMRIVLEPKFGISAECEISGFRAYPTQHEEWFKRVRDDLASVQVSIQNRTQTSKSRLLLNNRSHLPFAPINLKLNG